MDVTVTGAYLGLGGGVLALLLAYWLYAKVSRQDPGTERMQEIAAAIQEGALAFLRREYRTLAVFVIVLAAVIFVAGMVSGPGCMPPATAVAFLVGAVCSAAAGFIGMRAATKANVRTANAARTGGMAKALEVAFSGGAIMGMSVRSEEHTSELQSREDLVCRL